MDNQADGTTRSFGSFVRMRRLPAIFHGIDDQDADGSTGHAVRNEAAVAGRVGSQDTLKAASDEESNLGHARCA